MRLWSTIIEGLRMISSIALVLLVVSSTADIISRFLFDAPFNGLVLVITEALFPAITFFAAGYMARTNSHVRIVFFLTLLPRPSQIWVERFFSLITVFFWLFIMIAAADRFWEAIVRNYRPNVVFGIPIYVSFGIVALGSFVAAVEGLFLTLNPNIDEKGDVSYD